MIKITRAEQDILVCAKYLFATKGYHNTTVREITDAAQLSSSMLHYYYGSKENLLLHILSSILNEIQSIIRRGNDWERLNNYIDHTINYMCQNENSVRIIFQESVLTVNGMIKNTVQDIYDSHRSLFLEILQEGMSKGLFKEDINYENLYYMSVGTMRHFFDYSCLSGSPKPDGKSVETIKIFLKNLLKTQLKK